MRSYRNALLVNIDQNSTSDRKLELDTTGQAKLNDAGGDHPHAVTALDQAPKAVILQVADRRRDCFPSG